jgi:GAF domain-containing protein
VRAVLSVALVVDDEGIGAIKVYSDRPANYGTHDGRVMSLFADQAAILLANTQSLQQARRLSRALTEALSSRDAVVRATGVLLAQGAADQDTALLELTDAATRSGQTVQQVARELLAAVVARNADSTATSR